MTGRGPKIGIGPRRKERGEEEMTLFRNGRKRRKGDGIGRGIGPRIGQGIGRGDRTREEDRTTRNREKEKGENMA